MRILWIVYSIIFAAQKVVLPMFFWLLALTTAPEDTTELMHDSRAILESLNGNVAIDISILVLGLVGLLYTFGSGNWRLVIHRYASKPRLERLRDDARKTAEDIATTLSNDRNISSVPVSAGSYSQQDTRYLSRHMLEAHSITKRLVDAGYCEENELENAIGVAGATTFAAERSAKLLYSASENIRCDLQDGFLPIITKP